MSTHTTAPKNTACGIDGCATGKPAVHVLGEDFPIAPEGTALGAFHSPFDVKPIAEALKVQQYGSMKDDYRGSFPTGDADWSWGQWDDGTFWAECIEVFGDDESLYGKCFESDTLKSLFTDVRSEVGASWATVRITDDWGKSKSVKL